MSDLTQRFGENPVLGPRDLHPSVEGVAGRIFAGLPQRHHLHRRMLHRTHFEA